METLDLGIFPMMDEPGPICHPVLSLMVLALYQVHPIVNWMIGQVWLIHVFFFLPPCSVQLKLKFTHTNSRIHVSSQLGNWQNRGLDDFFGSDGLDDFFGSGPTANHIGGWGLLNSQLGRLNQKLNQWPSDVSDRIVLQFTFLFL